MLILAIIPARSGSKGVPQKNIKLLAGHPLIAYSIIASQLCSKIERTIVSTDSQEFAEIALSYGAEVPFLRPRELAEDDTLDLPVFQHALRWLGEREGYLPDIVVNLRPTSPLRKAEDIDKGIELLIENPEADSVRSVSTPSQNPFKMWRIVHDYLQPVLGSSSDELYNAPGQSLPAVYWQNGYVDIARYDTIMAKNSMTGQKILPLVMDDAYPVDIDSLIDFEVAEMFMQKLTKGKGMI